MGYTKVMYQEYIQERMVNESMRAELHWMEQEFLANQIKPNNDIPYPRRN